MSNLKKTLTTGVSVLAIGVLSFSIYHNVNSENDKSIVPSSFKKEISEKTAQTILISKDFNSTSSLDKMVDNAEFIFVGEYEGLEEKWNMSGDTENENNYVEGHLYNFKVSEVLKGESDDSIKINHRFSENLPVEVTSGDEVISEDGVLIQKPTSSKMYTVENKDPLYIKPETGKKYVVFLNKGDTGNYYAAIEPYLIEIDEENKAVLKSNLIDLDTQDLTTTSKVGDQEVVLSNDIDQEIKDTISGQSFKNLKKEILESLQ
ncbi:cardiolipin synthase (plasmid) [Exiguobacterium acetylicum]